MYHWNLNRWRSTYRKYVDWRRPDTKSKINVGAKQTEIRAKAFCKQENSKSASKNDEEEKDQKLLWKLVFHKLL